MAPRRWPLWRVALALTAWSIALALLPWWLGLPLLLSLAAVVVLLQGRLIDDHANLIRQALRWGLPGLLFAVQYALGGDAFAWGTALLGALAGYTLLAGLDAWLDRELRRAPPVGTPSDWPELALAPVGPPAEIIELLPPDWQGAADRAVDPLGGHAAYRAGSWWFDIGGQIAAVDARSAFSPGGRWFAAPVDDGRGVLLWDRQRERQHRLRGWQLAGWYREKPWLQRHADDVPLALSAVLGEDDIEDSDVAGS